MKMYFLKMILLCNFFIVSTSQFTSWKFFTKSFFQWSRKLGQIVNLAESCTRDWINTKYSGLAETFKNELYGQEIVQTKLPLILGHYWQKGIGSNSLFICFYGGTGTGKSFTAELINRYMFPRVDRSHYYLFFSGLDYSSSSWSELKSEMIESIEEAVNECHYSVIVFDDVDKYPSEFIDSVLHNFIQGNRNDDNKKSQVNGGTFIFITSVGAKEIMERTLEIKNSFFSSYNLENYESVKDMIISESKDSFFNSSLVKGGSVKYFIPFLPLKEDTLIQCLEKILLKFKLKYPSDTYKDVIFSNILREINRIPESDPTFFISGCKRLSNAVAFQIDNLKNIIDEL